MKASQVLLGVAAAFVLLFVAVQALAQERSQIQVKGTEVVTGVIIVDVVKGEQHFELHCNQGSSLCKVLKAGAYQMVELPEHWGMYECKNVEIYTNDSKAPENKDQVSKDKIGAYCMVTK
jgi:competence protein ComGC